MAKRNPMVFKMLRVPPAAVPATLIREDAMTPDERGVRLVSGLEVVYLKEGGRVLRNSVRNRRGCNFSSGNSTPSQAKRRKLARRRGYR